MEEVLHNFGVEWQLVLAQVINFLIIFYLLKRFLYKPVFNLLKKRENAIKQGLSKADESKKALEEALEKEKKIIKEAQETAKKIIQEAKEQSETVGKNIEEKAKKQADSMIESARTQIDLETRKAEKELEKHVSELAITLLKKSLDNVFTGKEQSEIVAKAVKSLKSN
ncbi:MAG TPA: F0F1 ATP synthase subunit B [Patescibacteria group bacterium]|nr:F0F1 ATP synthase subunit B [Patescibacteria group bacterium]